LPGYPSELHWAPVGSYFSVALAPTPFVDDHYMSRKVYVFDAENGAIVSSFPNPGKLGRTAWSPDARHLAVVSAQDINDPQEGRLLIASVADGSLQDALPDFESHVESVAWEDADTVKFLASEGVWSTFGEIRRDRTQRKVFLPSGRASASAFSLSADGQAAAFVIDSATHPGEVFVMRHGDPGPERLTNSNPWLEEMRFSRQEVVPFIARDGLRLEGLLIHPLDEKPGTAYPLIMRVHGGPESHDRQGWLTSYHSPGQLGAAKGFAVFYPNYRGSTGRGVAFSKLGQGDPAGKEFDDLVDAVDTLVRTGLVDRKRVGITGGSYGGYASAWCATYYSEHFAAAVMAVGISDKIAKTGTTDIPNEEYLVHARKRPWDDWNAMLTHSPIYHVEKAQTPILILHGKDDTRVHPAQSLALFRFLKLRKEVPVRLVLYPGEGHGNRKAAARLDYNVRMMQWFEHYLQGPGGDPPDYDLDYSIASVEEKKEAPGSGVPPK
jgi:dipeptidyl aminopeptidase/acylaminoacyl peptidase